MCLRVSHCVKDYEKNCDSSTTNCYKFGTDCTSGTEEILGRNGLGQYSYHDYFLTLAQDAEMEENQCVVWALRFVQKAITRKH